MTTDIEDSCEKTLAPRATPAKGSCTSTGEEKDTISPAQRWLLIRERAYIRAQKRAFVGGNPFEDWLEAEREIDDSYTTDFTDLFALTDAEEMREKFRDVLAGYGLGHLGVDALLEKHADGMEKLAALNRKLMSSTSELANQQTAVFQDALSEAVKTLQALAQGKVSTDGITKQAELSTQAIQNALSHLRALTESVTAMASPAPRKRSGDS